MENYSKLKPEGYIPRVVDKQLQELLGTFGGVEVRGPRWCGKSWTSLSFAQSVTRVDEGFEVYSNDPALTLVGEHPHLIDEWQDVPSIWNSVRHAIDDSANQSGQYLLTGSSAPLPSKNEKKRHSGAGRIARLRMSTMTLAEMGVSTRQVSLGDLFAGKFSPTSEDLGLDDIADILCRGGWPALVNRGESRDSTAHQVAAQYLSSLFEETIPKAGKSPILARRIAQALARNVATSAKLGTLAQDAAAGEGSGVTAETVSSYIREFVRNYFIYELPGWDAPVKSKSRLRTKPKRYFADPSLAVALLGVGKERLLQDAQLFGVLFESLALHDLSVYSQALPGFTDNSMRYYSDADGLEVDTVIELADGRWAAIEIKLGEAKVDEGMANLKRLRGRVAANPLARNPEPAFCAVLLGKCTAARYSKRDDVYVVPVGALCE